MEAISISITELVVLAGFVSKKYFYGISDPFFGMEPNEILSASESAKPLLDKKGLISYNFDGTIEITEKGQELIDRTLNASVYLFFDGLIDGDKQDRILYYKKADKETLCLYQGTDINIKEGTLSDCVNCVRKIYFDKNVNSKKVDTKFICKIDSLKEIVEFIDEQKDEMSLIDLKELSKKKLINLGCDNEIANIIIDGLFRSCSYLSFMAGSVKERNLKSSQFIITPNGILCMQTLNNIENEVSYQLISSNDVDVMIKDVVSSLEVS